ncbi:MAG: aminopeptidase [Oscillospiraceae bacterium]|nr:aminopeptidase [Oscillospiraceae bacterium]
MDMELLYAPQNGWDRVTGADREEMTGYCRRYMDFMDRAKTEREAVTETIRLAEAHGFAAYRPGMDLRPGDKIYQNNRGKAILLAVIGEKPLSEGCHIAAAHADSPRLDLKPNPLFEDSELCYLKTHYYGGIKKYQWTAVPLALHGVITTVDGTVHTVIIGEDEGDPVFCVTDLLIHLAGDQMKKTLGDGISGENLQVLFGSRPIGGEGGDRVKRGVLSLLHEKYGVAEEDLLTAELTLVPAGKARDVGLDRSMMAAYGHDDRVCAYAEFEPLLELGVPDKTAVCVLADKEEIGSIGVSGMQSQFFESFLEDLCESQGVKLRRCLGASVCLSADVSNAYDPLYSDTCDKRNNSQLNYGVALCKYTGARGKAGASDASSELFTSIRALFNREGVFWQIAELGKVDQGGGGTVAGYMANRNIDTLDAGVPVLSMHAPMEIVSKVDAYMAKKGMRAFYLQK